MCFGRYSGGRGKDATTSTELRKGFAQLKMWGSLLLCFTFHNFNSNYVVIKVVFM